MGDIETMSAEGLVKFFMSHRHCSFAQATRMAEAVIVRRKLKSDSAPKLSKSQLTLELDGDGPQEPTHRFEPDDPSINF